MNARLLVTATATVWATSIAAQTLDSRIAAVHGGMVAFEFATRPNVCGNGSSIEIDDESGRGNTMRSHRSGIHISSHGTSSYESCETGPARVMLRRDGARVSELRVTVGGVTSRADAELGDVSPADAVQYLLALAPSLSGSSAGDAITSAEIADGVVVWPRLLQIAKNTAASDAARKAAVFWVSQEASDAATAGLDSVANDDDGSLSVRSDALFYLSQRPSGEGIPALVRVAETSKSMKLRKDAIFFLAQSRDDRALALFERLLTRR